MKSLVTDAVGTYLCETALARDDDVLGANLNLTVHSNDLASLLRNLTRYDIHDLEEVNPLIARSCPDLIFHTAAHGFFALSSSAPAETLETNVVGTANVYGAIRAANLDPLVIVACSSAHYGDVCADFSQRMLRSTCASSW